eukprot:Rmarinus@m.27561
MKGSVKPKSAPPTGRSDLRPEDSSLLRPTIAFEAWSFPGMTIVKDEDKCTLEKCIDVSNMVEQQHAEYDKLKYLLRTKEDELHRLDQQYHERLAIIESILSGPSVEMLQQRYDRLLASAKEKEKGMEDLQSDQRLYNAMLLKERRLVAEARRRQDKMQEALERIQRRLMEATRLSVDIQNQAAEIRGAVHQTSRGLSEIQKRRCEELQAEWKRLFRNKQIEHLVHTGIRHRNDIRLEIAGDLDEEGEAVLKARFENIMARQRDARRSYLAIKMRREGLQSMDRRIRSSMGVSRLTDAIERFFNHDDLRRSSLNEVHTTLDKAQQLREEYNKLVRERDQLRIELKTRKEKNETSYKKKPEKLRISDLQTSDSEAIFLSDPEIPRSRRGQEGSSAPLSNQNRTSTNHRANTPPGSCGKRSPSFRTLKGKKNQSASDVEQWASHHRKMVSPRRKTADFSPRLDKSGVSLDDGLNETKPRSPRSTSRPLSARSRRKSVVPNSPISHTRSSPSSPSTTPWRVRSERSLVSPKPRPASAGHSLSGLQQSTLEGQRRRPHSAGVRGVRKNSATSVSSPSPNPSTTVSAGDPSCLSPKADAVQEGQCTRKNDQLVFGSECSEPCTDPDVEDNSSIASRDTSSGISGDESDPRTFRVRAQESDHLLRSKSLSLAYQTRKLTRVARVLKEVQFGLLGLSHVVHGVHLPREQEYSLLNPSQPPVPKPPSPDHHEPSRTRLRRRRTRQCTTTGKVVTESGGKGTPSPSGIVVFGGDIPAPPPIDAPKRDGLDVVMEDCVHLLKNLEEKLEYMLKRTGIEPCQVEPMPETSRPLSGSRLRGMSLLLSSSAVPAAPGSPTPLSSVPRVFDHSRDVWTLSMQSFEGKKARRLTLLQSRDNGLLADSIAEPLSDSSTTPLSPSDAKQHLLSVEVDEKCGPSISDITSQPDVSLSPTKRRKRSESDDSMYLEGPNVTELAAIDESGPESDGSGIEVSVDAVDHTNDGEIGTRNRFDEDIVNCETVGESAGDNTYGAVEGEGEGEGEEQESLKYLGRISRPTTAGSRGTLSSRSTAITPLLEDFHGEEPAPATNPISMLVDYASQLKEEEAEAARLQKVEDAKKAEEAEQAERRAKAQQRHRILQGSRKPYSAQSRPFTSTTFVKIEKDADIAAVETTRTLLKKRAETLTAADTATLSIGSSKSIPSHVVAAARSTTRMSTVAPADGKDGSKMFRAHGDLRSLRQLLASGGRAGSPKASDVELVEAEFFKMFRSPRTGRKSKLSVEELFIAGGGERRVPPTTEKPNAKQKRLHFLQSTVTSRAKKFDPLI